MPYTVVDADHLHAQRYLTVTESIPHGRTFLYRMIIRPCHAVAANEQAWAAQLPVNDPPRSRAAGAAKTGRPGKKLFQTYPS